MSSPLLPTDAKPPPFGGGARARIADYLPPLLAGIAIAVAASALLGWALDIEPLKRFSPTMVAMNPTSAVCAIGLGIALLLIPLGPSLRGITVVLGATVSATTLLKLLGLATGVDPGIDHLFFAVKHAGDNPVAPNSAATLALLGVAMAAASSNRSILIGAAQTAAVGAFLISLVAATGYAVGIVGLYGIGEQYPMALHTAIAGLALSLGLLALHPNRGLLEIREDTPITRGRRPFSTRLLTITVILIAIVVSAAFFGERQSDALANTILQTETSKQRTIQSLSLLQDGEIGQRGYLLTGDEVYLQPYIDALPEIEALQARLKNNNNPDPARAERAHRLNLLISARLEILQESIALRRAGKVDEAIALEKTNRGKAVMDNIRQLVAEIIASQDTRMATEERDQSRIESTVRVTEVLGLFLFAVAAVTLLGQTREALAAQRRAALSQARAAEVERSANRAKSRFLAGMSHELRTPMTAVLGMCDLLLTSKLTGDQREITEVLARSARTLLDLLNDILDLSKIEAGRLTLESTDFRLSTVLRQIQDLFTPLASQKGLTLDIDVEPTLENVFKGDPKRLQQILFNLVGNAVKFTDAGRVTVRLRQQEGDNGPVWNVFSVEDTGPGISEEARARLFREFEQEEVATSRRYGGSGLGLSICKRLTEAMGGSIGVESIKGVGSKFTFEIPLRRGDKSRIVVVERASPLAAAKALEGRKLRVLVAEDTPPNQFRITRMLSLWGHDVVAVNNGREAVEAADRSWDVILMDMQMPVMDGIEAVHLIRTGGGPSSRTPIIALTADAIQESQRAYLDAGCDAIVTKPIDWTALARQIAALIGTTPLSAEPANLESISPPAPATVPLIDHAILDEFSQALEPADMVRLVTSAMASIDNAVTQLTESIGRNDRDGAKRAGHKLAGMASQVGAARLAAIARAIETEAPNMAAVEAAARELPELAATTAAALAQVIAGLSSQTETSRVASV
jgi:signal transduction histidine kinase/CheY-like chemotaxis protein/HPt (histidine-containing phosphotransfer) domain-containing protein